MQRQKRQRHHREFDGRGAVLPRRELNGAAPRGSSEAMQETKLRKFLP